MRFSQPTAFVAAAAALLLPGYTFAQTYTKCNPLQGTCPADPALGGSKTVDFTSGASSDFEVSGGSASYSSNGIGLTVAKQGDAPTITSKWYIMFGKVEVTMKAAPGTGIVSSSVMQSDDLDEIDWEWLGGDSSQVQSNYFGKGITGGYNRGAFHSDPTSQSAFDTYTIEWTSEQIVWSINGNTVRVLTPATAGNQYPQSPMQVKVGIWAGGDPSNAPGTISWAGGPTDYSQGPFTMYVKSIQATDYSTGSAYSYSDTSGSWQSIRSTGGTIDSGSPNGVVSSAPAITSTTSGQPVPFDGTHANPSSTTVPTTYPWVGTATTMSTSVASCYTGLPSGWTCSSNGKALPPSSASSTSLVSSSTVSASASSSVLSSSVETTITSAPTYYTPTPTPVVTATQSMFTGAASSVKVAGSFSFAAMLLSVIGMM